MQTIHTFSTADAANLADVSYRQADYWAREGFVAPYNAVAGSGAYRRWSAQDVLDLRVVKALLSHNVSRPTINQAVDLAHLGHPFLWIQADTVGTGDTEDLFEVLSLARETIVVNLGALRLGLDV